MSAAAFPVSTATNIHDAGMSLRDYFAAHSVQPGCGEIATLAGLTYRSGFVWKSEHEQVGSFDNWFNALPLEERLSLFARVKFAMADAMLAVRAAPAPTPKEPTP